MTLQHAARRGGIEGEGGVLRKALFTGFLLVLGIWAWSSPISLIVFNPERAGSDSGPEAWHIHVTKGTPDIARVPGEQFPELRLRSRKASFGLERNFDVNLKEFPYLNWRWKVTQLPDGGDFRSSLSDDQAAQVLVVFPDRRILTYLWDSSAPKGTAQPASYLPMVHIFAFVCRSGPAERNQWLAETRNLVDDFRKAFGFDPERVKGLRLQINSQHTGTFAESYFGEVAFLRTPQ